MQCKSVCRAVLALTWLVLPLTGGCLVTSSNKETHSGNYVADETLHQIEKGKTSASWIRSTLGQPSQIDQIGGGAELWKYRYTEKKDSSGAVFLIFGGSSQSENTHTVFVEVKNDVVSNYWRG